MDDQLLEHVLDIKERLSAIESKLETHSQSSTETREKVDMIEMEVNQAKGSLKMLKWIVGLSGGSLFGMLIIEVARALAR